jgi:type I restriction enzyme, S subunit
MAGDWATVPLGQLTKRITKGTTPTTLGHSFVDRGVNFVKSEAITDRGQIDESTFAFIDSATHDALGRSILEENDVLFSMAGVYLGKTAVVPRSILPANTNQAVGIIRLDQTKAVPRFIHYALSSPKCRALVYRSVAQSAQPNFNLQQIGDLPVPALSLPEQRAIAHILGTLDDKIELNRRMNATLEEMARALFKSWFVDFDPVRAKMGGRDTGLPAEIADLFPDAFEESELGDVPMGWKVGTIRDCCRKIENGGTPQRSEPKYWQPATVPWLTSGEVRQSIVIGTDNMISEEGLAHSSAKMWPSGTTVVALYGATAGQVCLLAQEMCTNQACCGLVPAENMRSYLYLGASSSVASLELQARGSAQQNLSQQIVADFRILVAEGSVVTVFEDCLSPIFERWILNLHGSRTLAALRDALLPKLISGEVRVPDAERMIGHAV